MFDADGDGRAEDVFYNGYRAGRDIIGPAYYDEKGHMTPCDQPQGARHLGVQNMAEACMQGRGVMIDLEANFGRSGRKVSYEDLMEVMRNDRVEVEPGDFVLFRTGFDQMLSDMGKQPDRETLFSTSCALDGRDARLQQWVTESGAVGSSRTTLRWRQCRPALVWTISAPHCRCTRTACSASAATWARCSI